MNEISNRLVNHLLLWHLTPHENAEANMFGCIEAPLCLGLRACGLLSKPCFCYRKSLWV